MSVAQNLSDVPKSDEKWFALIEPEITVAADEASSEEFERIARRHMEQVVDRLGMDVDLSKVEFDANRRLKAAHGRANSERVSLSMHSLERNGWQNLMETTRHELVHVWQGQNLDDYQPHGESFERWMDVLDVRKKWGTVTDAKWKTLCPNGHVIGSYHRMGPNVKAALRGTLYCASCGKGTKGELEVYRDGERVGEEVLRDDDGVDLSRGDKIILLHNAGDEDELYGYEWKPQTIYLTDLTGIGEKTAAELTDVVKIDELVDGDGGLSERVEEAVSVQYVDALAEEINSRFEEAVENRDEDDLEKLERAIESDVPWWHRRECFDGVGRREEVANKLESAKNGGKVEIRLDSGESMSGTVGEDRSASEKRHRFEVEDTDRDIGEAKIHVYRDSARIPAVYDESDGFLDEKVGEIVEVDVVSTA